MVQDHVQKEGEIKNIVDDLLESVLKSVLESDGGGEGPEGLLQDEVPYKHVDGNL